MSEKTLSVTWNILFVGGETFKLSRGLELGTAGKKLSFQAAGRKRKKGLCQAAQGLFGRVIQAKIVL